MLRLVVAERKRTGGEVGAVWFTSGLDDLIPIFRAPTSPRTENLKNYK